jgi:hypothetical protein
MNIPPGYITREKADRIEANLRAGLLAILNRLRERLGALAPQIAASRDAKEIEAMIRRETEQAAAEIDALQQTIREQLDSTEH